MAKAEAGGLGAASLPRSRRGLVLLVLVALLVVSVLLGVSIGAVRVPIGEAGKILLNGTGIFHFARDWPAPHESILLNIRLPRVLSGVAVGAALAVAGVIFQGLLRNPMADPYLIGTSGGAALGATIALLIPISFRFLGFGLVSILAFVGAVAACFLVYNISRVGNRTSVVTLVLAGYAISSMLTAVMTGLMFLSGDALRKIVLWLMGGLVTSNWDQLVVIGPLILGACAVVYIFVRPLNTFLLGEEQAAYLGINIERTKVILLMLGALLTAAAVSLSGLVGFLGLLIPHVVRLILGPDHRFLLPASMLAGGTFFVLSDLLARSILAPVEIPVGVITAFIGSPFFIYLLRRSRKQYEF